MGCGASKVAAEEKKDKALKSHSSKKKRDEQKGGDEWWRQKVTPGECVAKYEYGRVLGRGASSVVREATCRKTGERVACKIVTIKGVKHSERVKHRESALREVDVWSSVNHDGIVNLVEFFVETDNVTLVMELCRGNTLLDEVLDRGGYSVEDARHIMQQVLKTMAYLHECRVVHRDLKLENLLLRRKRDLGSVKLADMGFSTRLDAKGFYHTMAGTPAYLAPELIRVIEGRKGAERNFGTATDMWSAGVSLFILLGGYPPFDADTTKEVFARVELEPVSFNSPVWENVGQDAKELIKKLLHKDPSKRYTAQEALEDKWIISNQKAVSAVNGKGQGLEKSYANLKTFLGKSNDGKGGKDGGVGGIRPDDQAIRAGKSRGNLDKSRAHELDESIPKSTFLQMQLRHDKSRGRHLNDSLRRIFHRNASMVKEPLKPQKSIKEMIFGSGKKAGANQPMDPDTETDTESESDEPAEAEVVNNKTQKYRSQYFRPTDSKKRMMNSDKNASGKLRGDSGQGMAFVKTSSDVGSRNGPPAVRQNSSESSNIETIELKTPPPSGEKQAQERAAKRPSQTMENAFSVEKTGRVTSLDGKIQKKSALKKPSDSVSSGQARTSGDGDRPGSQNGGGGGGGRRERRHSKNKEDQQQPPRKTTPVKESKPVHPHHPPIVFR